MCGIAGFSLSPNSTINARQLANALLTVIEDRGYMASGFAWQTNNKMGVHKDAVPGSMLSLKSMPKESRNVILHTRLATHGSTADNRNNHPVMSPSDNIALVHNGVIYNHHSVRTKVSGDLPDVDTSVIPAVIEQHGVASLDLLDGDAAIAWFNRSEPKVMHLARYQYSPLVMCQIEDGSFIFCSTEALLWKVLIQLDLMPTWLQSAKELEYFTIREGMIASSDMLPEPKYVDKYDYGYYRHQTAGAKGGVTTIGKTSGVPKGSTARSVYDSFDDYYDDYEEEMEMYYWNKSFTNALAKDTCNDNEYGEVYEGVEVAETDKNVWKGKTVYTDDVSYYTTIHDVQQGTDMLMYDTHEVEVWKDELYLLANEEGVTLVDYGYVIQDVLVSTMNDANIY